MMEDLKHRIDKVHRLKEVEQSRLTTLVAELSAARIRVAKRKEQLAAVSDQLNNLPSASRPAIADLRQISVWGDHLDKVAAELVRLIEQAKSEEEEIVRQITRQHVTVQGWETLLERLGEELNAEQMRSEFRSADDRFLSHGMVQP